MERPFRGNRGGSREIRHGGEGVVVLGLAEAVAEAARIYHGERFDWLVLRDPSGAAPLYALHRNEVGVLLDALDAARRYGDVGDVWRMPLRDVLSLGAHAPRHPFALPPEIRTRTYFGEEGAAAGQEALLGADGSPVQVASLRTGDTSGDAEGVRDLIRNEFRWMEGEEADVEYVELRPHEAAAPEAPPPEEERSPPAELDLGAPLGGGSPPRGGPSPAPAGPSPPNESGPAEERAAALISGQAPQKAPVGGLVTVRYRIERAGTEAQPFDEQFEVDIETHKDIRVVLVTKGDALELTSARMHDVAPPTAGSPVEGAFQLVAVQQGEPAELSLMFFQGGSHLGSLAFTVRIVTEAGPRTTEVNVRRSETAPRRRADDEVLIWTIVEDRDPKGLRRYEHLLVGVQLGQFREFSKPIQDSGSGYAAMRTAYLERTYERVLHPVRSREDLEELQVRTRTSGTSLCRMLMDPEVTRRLWEWRDRVRMIRVHSYDPLIPWELVRLQHPDTRELDDRYLAEYGLVRWLPDLDPASAHLRLDRWRYLAAHYPHGSAPSVAGEVDYFTRDLPARGADPTPIEPTLKGVLEALEGEVDVLHFACHGEANLGQVESARLLISDQKKSDGSVAPVVVEASDVVAQARFTHEPGPVVFLTACEGGRAAPSLTDWEGWPHAFLKGGASVFVGTSWSVREKPAYAFSRSFYEALLEGRPLAAAATAGRLAAKELGDASWLAYKVYGNPLARAS